MIQETQSDHYIAPTVPSTCQRLGDGVRRSAAKVLNAEVKPRYGNCGERRAPVAVDLRSMGEVFGSTKDVFDNRNSTHSVDISLLIRESLERNPSLRGTFNTCCEDCPRA